MRWHAPQDFKSGRVTSLFQGRKTHGWVVQRVQKSLFVLQKGIFYHIQVYPTCTIMWITRLVLLESGTRASSTRRLSRNWTLAILSPSTARPWATGPWSPCHSTVYPILTAMTFWLLQCYQREDKSKPQQTWHPRLRLKHTFVLLLM